MMILDKPAPPEPESISTERLPVTTSGTVITQDADTGFPDLLIINAAYGEGHNVAKGTLCPDEYRVFKSFVGVEGKDPIVGRQLGSKELRAVCQDDLANPVCMESTSFDEQNHFALNNDQVIELATIACAKEAAAGKPVEIEWTFDAKTDEFLIKSCEPLLNPHPKALDPIILYELEEENPHSLLSGVAIGPAIVQGTVSLVRDLADAADFKEGTILVTASVDENWFPLLEKASGLITDHGGRVSEAASMCRTLELPAILGTIHATSKLNPTQEITLDCSNSEHGIIYRDHLPFRRSVINLENIPHTHLKRCLSIDDPETAQEWWQLPSQGIGMAKIEGIISKDIGIHPMALVRYDEIQDENLRLKIDRLTLPYKTRTDYFVDRLARGIAHMAAIAFPSPIVVRFNDFTSETYTSLMERGLFEPLEHNPKLGKRGAARYLSKDYREAFELECQAVNRARNEMGFTNINVAVPFCRTVREAEQVVGIIQDSGLRHDQDDFEIHLIAEVPSNIILCHEFMRIFDRLDIDLDTLTQLVLSIDLDKKTSGKSRNHLDAAVLSALSTLVDEAHCSGARVTIFGLLEDHRSELMDCLIGAGIDAFAFEPENFVRGSLQVAAGEKFYFENTPTNPNMA